MADDEFEKFEITDQDLADEFNINRRRPMISKHQAIYGVFADESDEEREQQRRPNFSRKPKNYTAPISFVGGGVQQAGKPSAAETAKKETNDDDNSDIDGKPLQDDRSSNSSSEDEDDVRAAFPSVFGKQAQVKKNVASFKHQNQGSLAGLRADGTKHFAGWEKHTKGIGQKLMMKMGYKPGKGLGRDLQGISAPIEAKLRKGRGALGLYGAEHHARPQQESALPPTTVDSEEEEDREYRKQLHQWKKGPQQESKKKMKYVYKTVDEVIAEGGTRKIRGDTSNLSRVKVIDMTGPEQRILSGYHAIHQQHSRPSEMEADNERKTGSERRLRNFVLPELQHNLGLLLDMTEQEIIRNDREVRHQKDRVTALQHEETKMVSVLEQERWIISRFEIVLEMVQILEERSKDDSTNPLTLPEAATMFRKLQDEFYEEYKVQELGQLAIPIVYPLIKKHLENWEPLQDTKFGMEVLQQWKDVLETHSCRPTLNPMMQTSDMDMYQQLVWQVWIPHLRKAVLAWSVRECEPLIELLENWMPLLPPWIYQNIQDQLVFPRLHQEVENWNPLTDCVPIHAWIHPWLPLMGAKLEPLYAPIRQKLSNALSNWHPSDQSAKQILYPWAQVFARGTLEAFVVKNILPRLVLCMQEFVINPHSQHLEPWYWVMAWEEFLPLPSLVSLLDKHFFPKWMQVLFTWLGHNPNYDEVTKWFMGWKSMFSEQLLAVPVIKEHFTRSLDMMSRAVSMGYQPPGAKEHIAYVSMLERQREADTSQAQANKNYEAISQGIMSGGGSLSNLALTFKDLLERKAQEMGILFMPVPNRYQEGKQIHRFGRLLLYIDRGVILVQNDQQRWAPSSLQAVVDMAR